MYSKCVVFCALCRVTVSATCAGIEDFEKESKLKGSTTLCSPSMPSSGSGAFTQSIPINDSATEPGVATYPKKASKTTTDVRASCPATPQNASPKLTGGPSM